MKKIFLTLVLLVFVVFHMQLINFPQTLRLHPDSPVPSLSLKSEYMPCVNSEQWHTYNAGVNYHVFLKDGLVSVSPFKEKDTHVFEIFNGYLKGVDHGEWGGSVTFVSSNNSESYSIIEENCKGFVKIKNDVYVLTRISHMFSDEGILYRLALKDNKWTAVKILPLNSAPQAFYVMSDTLYIATNYYIIQIKNEAISKVLVSNSFLDGLYPNSIVFQDNCFYVGLRGGIYTYTPATGQQRWFPIS